MPTILIVDDHADNREYLVTLLGYRGHRPLEAEDGLEALAVVRAERPDLVIADVLMPTMDGYEFVQQMRAEPEIADTRVIFYTATYQEREARVLAERCGVLRVLTKPTEPETILSTIDDVLGEAARPLFVSDAEGFTRQHARLLTDKLTQVVGDLDTTSQRFAALVEINLKLASERDPRRLLDGVCRDARRLIASRHAILAVGDMNGQTTTHHVTSGIDAATAAAIEVPSLRDGIMGGIVAERSTRRLADCGTDARTVGLPAGYPPFHSLLAAPVISLAHAYGWICLSDRLGGDEFSSDDERLLGMLAAQAGRIYENGRLYSDLQQTEERFRQLAENIREVFFLADPVEDRMLYVSPAYEQIWGRSCHSLYTNAQSWIDAVHASDRELALDSARTIRTAGGIDVTFRITRPDHSLRWIHMRGFPVKNAAGEIYRVAGIAEDITERKEQEERIVRLTRIHSVLSSINSAIVRIRDRGELFEEACRIAVEHGGFGMAWIGLVDRTTLEIWPVACKGFDLDIEQLGTIVRAADNGASAGKGTMGRAIREKKPAFSKDLAAESDVGVPRQEALDRGYRSVVSLPLLIGGECVGVFVLLAQEAGLFDDDELGLLTELANDISFAMEYIEKDETARYLAYYDPLTDLTNRGMFHERLGQYVHAAKRNERPLSVAVIDLERFKMINDSLGRHAGDALIRQIAERLKGQVSDPSRLARVGADHFAVIFTDVAHPDDAARLIEELFGGCFGPPFELDGEEIRASARAGIAMFPDDGDDADTLFRNAETAISKAKTSGDRYLFFTQAMSEQVAGKMNLENQLRRALENDEFLLHYQPKVELRTGDISGLEALVRWQSPELGRVPPADFIPLLEEIGLIGALGKWVLEQAVADYSRWAEQAIQVPRIAVNVSALQLRQHDFVQQIEDTIRTGGPGFGLELEVTESLIMTDVDEHIDMFRQIGRLGVHVAIDDFGTGYSSLRYIARLPVDALKIDRSFITNMTDSSEDMTVVATVISLGHEFKLKVVAEGVESEEQAERLRRLGCDEIQGFLISEPLSPDAVERMLRARQDDSDGR